MFKEYRLFSTTEDVWIKVQAATGKIIDCSPLHRRLLKGKSVGQARALFKAEFPEAGNWKIQFIPDVFPCIPMPKPLALFFSEGNVTNMCPLGHRYSSVYPQEVCCFCESPLIESTETLATLA